MAKFKNVGPLGALDIDGLGLRGIEVGEVFEVPDHLAAAFVGQVEIYEVVDVPQSVHDAYAASLAEEADIRGETVAPAGEGDASPGPARTRQRKADQESQEGEK